MQMSSEEMNPSADMLKGHCLYSTLAYLKEHFSKERVDIMEQYIKNEKAAPQKARKRYVKVPSSKRIRYMDNTPVYPLTNDPANTESLLPLIQCYDMIEMNCLLANNTYRKKKKW